MDADLILDRARGSLLGLAIGDALGAPVEFKKPGEFAPVTELRPGGHGILKVGQWTDDTAMSLCLADSLLECRGFSATDLMNRFLDWRDAGYNSCTGTCFDIGLTIGDALARYGRTQEPFAGRTDPQTAGNGGMMRVAPAVIGNYGNLDQALSTATAQCQTTHMAHEAVDCARVVAGLLWHALQGLSKEQILQEMRRGAAQWVTGDPESKVFPLIARRQPLARSEVSGSGYAVDSLRSVLWALETTDSFEAGVLAAVNLGNDADTTGAIYGQIAGAIYGAGAIPRRWREQVAWKKQIIDRAEQLVQNAPLCAAQPAPLERRGVSS